jgi:TonB family protein
VHPAIWRNGPFVETSDYGHVSAGTDFELQMNSISSHLMEAAMKAQAVAYGAAELKQTEHRYLTVGLGLSVAIHICVIAAYILKGVVIYDKPPFLPPYRGTPHTGDRIVQVYPDFPRIDVPPVPRGGGRHVGGKYAIPIPAPIAPSNEDTLLFKRGEPGSHDNAGGTGDPGDGGEGTGLGVLATEEEPPPFVVVEKDPVLVKKTEPVFPDLAVRAGLEGKVWVRIWVDKEGRAHKAEVLRSTSEIFNEAAVAAAMQFVFLPAYTNGGPVAVWVSIPFTFKLK